MFALDVFSEPQWYLALFMHLIPSFVLIALTIIAWKNEKVGGFVFMAAGFVMLVFTHFESLIISVPAFIIGTLFVWSSWKKGKK
jgi:thiosulfate reductase cytochrome b subunit